MYAVGPGVVWYRQPDEDEDAFRERVRISALAAGLTLELSRGPRRDSVCIPKRFSFKEETALLFAA
jgi:hypothetical protein